jgi:RNA-directed DNA polymerase
MRFLDFIRRLFGGSGGDGGREIEELAKRLGMAPEELLALRPAYTEYQLPKRSGGARRIAAPSPELKEAQRKILRRLLSRLPSHPAAQAFERGRSIVANASPHAGKAVVVKMDLQAFFDSISARRVLDYFRRLGWSEKASGLLAFLCTWKGSLPQGAPTSPRLSNLLNHRFDARLEGLARKLKATYTRYADDLTFSFAADDRSSVHTLLRSVKAVAREEGYRLHQKKKLQIRRRHHCQLVTGLVVNAGVKLPRSRRRWLRAVEHHLATGREASLSPAQLKGWQAFRSMVEGGARK